VELPISYLSHLRTLDQRRDQQRNQKEEIIAKPTEQNRQGHPRE